MGREFWIWLSSLEAPVKAAMITATATVTGAILAATVVFLQIGRQAGKARENDRSGEELKLKIEIYRSILSVCREALDAKLDVSNFIRMFPISIRSAKGTLSLGYTPVLPRERFSTFNEKWSAAHTKAVNVVITVEEWGIVDPRMKVFQVAFNAALYDAQKAYANYIDASMPIFPAPRLDSPDKTFPWSPPNSESLLKLERSGEQILDALSNIESYVEDFRVQMQQLLVGALFPGYVVDIRKPLNPALKVIELKRHKELIKYFEEETEWGRNVTRVNSAVRKRFGNGV